MTATADFFSSMGATFTSAGYTGLIGLIVFSAVAYGAIWLIRRAMQGPTPNKPPAS